MTGPGNDATARSSRSSSVGVRQRVLPLGQFVNVVPRRPDLDVCGGPNHDHPGLGVLKFGQGGDHLFDQGATQRVAFGRLVESDRPNCLRHLGQNEHGRFSR